jgi:hypothetical protein
MPRRRCKAHILAFLLNMVDADVADEPLVPCELAAAWVTTVERGVGSYAATCDQHDQQLRLDSGHVRSVRLPTT